MKISILTLFPNMFLGPFSESIIKRAIDNKLVEIEFIDIREFGIGKHKLVDDTPYGGGVGMIMRADVVKATIDSVRLKESKVILLSATGEKYTQKKAKEFSHLSHLILVCGHYEGIDYRIRNYIDEEISIGDYVLTGGEIPAMVIADSVLRLVPNVLKEDATKYESFSDENLLENPQFTKPPIIDGMKVPEVLLSGNHKEIESWRKTEAQKQTFKLRPDLTETQQKEKN